MTNETKDERPMVVPSWFVPGAGYSDPKFQGASELGRQVGLGSTTAWEELVPTLKAFWEDGPDEMPWQEARGAIYQAWNLARRETGARGADLVSSVARWQSAGSGRG